MGYEANIDTGQENHKADISKDDTNADSVQMPAAKLQEQYLANQEKYHNKSQGNGNFLAGVTKGMGKGTDYILADSIIRYRIA